MESLDATTRDERVWTWRTYATMWFAVSVNPGGYAMGASMASLGLRFWPALVSVLAGSCILIFPLVLNGVPGERYGIPFPVYCRAAFGHAGSHGAVLTRGAVAVLWLSFQSWSAATTISAAAFGGDNHDAILIFFALSAAHIVCILAGVSRFKHVLYACCPVVLAGTAAAVVWARHQASYKSLIATYNAEASSSQPDSTLSTVCAGANVVVATWSTMVLNVADVSRFAQTPNAQRVGQPLGSFVAFGWIAVVGVIASAAVQQVRGGDEWPWEIADLLGEWSQGPRIAGAVVVAVSVLSVNLVVNVLSPANDLMNLSPKKFSFKACALFSVAASVAACPWILFASPTSYLRTFLDGYSAATGAIAAVMLADFWIVRAGELDVDALYRDSSSTRRRRGNPYDYVCGHNPRAIIAILSAVGPCFPAFVDPDGATSTLAEVSWFFSFGVAGLVYLFLARVFPPAQSIWDPAPTAKQQAENTTSYHSLGPSAAADSQRQQQQRTTTFNYLFSSGGDNGNTPPTPSSVEIAPSRV